MPAVVTPLLNLLKCIESRHIFVVLLGQLLFANSDASAMVGVVLMLTFTAFREGLSALCVHRLDTVDWRTQSQRHMEKLKMEVSIPCWVFCPSRPMSPDTADLSHVVSIPCWVRTSKRSVILSQSFMSES